MGGSKYEEPEFAKMLPFRKKPVVVEAVQFFPDRHPWPEGVKQDDKSPTGYSINTLENVTVGHEVTPSDWIIRGVAGELYPCKADVFAVTYEPAASLGPQKQE